MIISRNVLSNINAVLVGDDSDFESNENTSGNEEGRGESNTGGEDEENGFFLNPWLEYNDCEGQKR